MDYKQHEVTVDIYSIQTWFYNGWFLLLEEQLHTIGGSSGANEREAFCFLGINGLLELLYVFVPLDGKMDYFGMELGLLLEDGTLGQLCDFKSDNQSN